MNLDNNEIFEEMYVKDKYAPYPEIEEISHGKELLIKKPYRNVIKLKCYEIIPGVITVKDHTDLMERYTNQDHIFEYKHPENILVITYVTTGRCQIPIGDDKYVFAKEGDMNMYIKSENPNAIDFIGESQFIHIIINKELITKQVQGYTKEYVKMINRLYDISDVYRNVIFEPDEDIKTVIHQMQKYQNKKRRINNNNYERLKILELIILLYEFNIHDEKYSRNVYSDVQIRVVRKIKNTLSRDIASYISLDVLSATYGINLTTMKNCFKDMYGKPLYKWYREYKFQRATDLIKNTTYPISKIANMVGYKSSSKFSKAFKTEMGVLPSSYRKKKNKK